MTENYIDKIEVDGVERPIRDTSGSVRYDAAQSLSDAQKAQARENINAAPGGFGLGIIDWNQAPESDANKIPGTGWFLAAKNVPTTSGIWFIRQESDGPSNNDALQTAWPQNLSAYYRGCLTQRYKISGTWSAWEWINPPMILGTEYRTTERYLGKPVYVKTINMGNLPGNAVKQSRFQSNNVVDKIVSVTGQCTSDSGVNMSLPYHAGSGPNWNTVIIIGATGAGTAQIVTFAEDFAGYTDACITVKYTKLAD